MPNPTINPVQIILDLAERNLRRHKSTHHPLAGSLAQGELAAVLRFLAEFYLTSEQCEQVKRIVDLHDQCNGVLTKTLD